MKITTKSKFIVNPAAKGGRARKAWPAIEYQLRDVFTTVDAVFTSRPGEAVDLARQALKDGCELIVAVGGDGTNNEVVNGFFEQGRPINPEAAFAPLTIGSGGDFVKTLGCRSCESLIARLAEGERRLIDVGKLTFVNHLNAQETRYFLNITSFGIGGEVDDRVNHSHKRFGGFTAFLYASLSAMAAYRGREVRLQVDAGDVFETNVFNVAVANGRYFGSGMMVAPQAELDDGLFDIVVMEQQPLVSILRAFPKIYSGTHLDNEKVRYQRARTLTATSDQVVLLDMDGEQPGRLPASFELLPHAIHLAV